MDLTGPQGVPYCKVTLNSQYLKIGLIQFRFGIWLATGFQGVPYFSHKHVEDFLLDFFHILAL